MLSKLRFVLAPSLLFPAAVLAETAPPGPYREGYDWPYPWHMMGWGWGFGWIFPLLMIFGIVFCIVMLSRMFAHAHGHRGSMASAMELLNERFAKGEISKEEFEEKRAVLVRRT